MSLKIRDGIVVPDDYPDDDGYSEDEEREEEAGDE